jgi:hypothetical protein
MAERIEGRAVGIGVAVGLAGTLLLGMAFRLMPFDVERHGLWLIYAFSYGAGALIDIACGATAGALARRRGALHGALAGLIANLLSPLIGYATMLVQGRGTAPIEFGSYVLAIAGSSLIGVVLATIAGAIAARIALRYTP